MSYKAINCKEPKNSISDQLLNHELIAQVPSVRKRQTGRRGKTRTPIPRPLPKHRHGGALRLAPHGLTRWHKPSDFAVHPDAGNSHSSRYRKPTGLGLASDEGPVVRCWVHSFRFLPSVRILRDLDWEAVHGLWWELCERLSIRALAGGWFINCWINKLTEVVPLIYDYEINVIVLKPEKMLKYKEIINYLKSMPRS